jgi:hypothetical protein
VRCMQGTGRWCWWLAGSVAKRAGSERLRAKWCVARASQCTTAQDEDGDVSGVLCRVGACVVRVQNGRVLLGTHCTLWARWAARSCRVGRVGALRTGGLGPRRPMELIVGVDARLVAR